ncbi:transposase [Candidatus Uhrbacteria bacterium]|nr:transposase [Candidatus Uhrbacteria bacterium]
MSIISYCLIPNHFHLAMRQEQDGGISKYLHKIGMRYAKYFNAKYGRKGRFFENAFQAKHISSDAYLEHIPRYIHLNALDLTAHDWRNGSVRNWNDALAHLEQYPWSSHHAYSTRSQAIPIIEMRIVKEMFPTPKEYISFLKQWSQAEISTLSLSDLLVTT